MDLSSPNAVREFLALCLDPGHGVKRTPAKLAGIMPGPLEDALLRFAPHLAQLRREVDEAEQQARAARKKYADGLEAWITGAPVKATFPIAGSDQWSWRCPEEGGGCGYQSVARFPTEQIAQGGYDDHRGQCAWDQTNLAPAADPSQCQQNRTGNFTRLTDPVNLGPHFYKDGAVGLRCVYCDVPAHWGGEPLEAPVVPTYVYNSRSVNRTAKHAVRPDDPRITLCPGAHPASGPMPAEEAARLPLCGGCRRALTGQQD